MFKKVLSVFLILVGSSLSVIAGEYFAGEYFENAADALVQLEKAEAAFKETIASLPEFEQAETYEKQGNHRGAEDIYKTIVKDYAGSDQSLEAQKKLIMLHTSREELQEAKAAFDELVKSFSGHKLIPGTVYRIAEHATRQDEHEMASQLYQYIVDNWPNQYYEIWAQSGVVISNIALGNMKGAEAAVDRLLTDFYENDGIAATIYDIAYQYKRFEEYERARQLYQYVLDTWPKCPYITWSKVGLAQSNIGLGDTITAETIIDGLIAGFDANTSNDSNLLPAAAEVFCYAGDCYRRLGKYEKSNNCYQKVIDGCPDYEYTWNALFMIGDNYQELKKLGAILESNADTKTEAVYEQLLEKYPDCKAAKITQDWLSHHKSE